MTKNKTQRKQTSRNNPDEWFNCVCPVCGERFHVKKYHLENVKHTPCCSRKCSAKYRSDVLMAGENNHQYGLRGNLNASWKSDERINSKGYRLIRCPDHPFRDQDDFVFEHRLVAERYLLDDRNSIIVNGKKYLSPDYVVHHKDFNRLNNSVENLQVMEKNEHQKLHTKLNPQLTDPVSGKFVKNVDVLKAKKITPTAILPKKATQGSACYDLYPDLADPVKVPPHSDVILQTNIAVSFPDEYCGLIFARSGISTKRHLRPSTCVSVIDNDYRGSIGLPVHNDSDEEQTIMPGERIAQMMLIKPLSFELEIVDSLDETERGENGFGSSGR